MKQNFLFVVMSLLPFCFFSSCNNNVDQPVSKQTVTDTVTKSTTTTSGKKVNTVYLSFDDGPLEGSEDIDDAVKQEGILVNVFVVGQHVLANKRMQGFFNLYENDNEIEIGNHSFSHAHDQYEKYYSNAENVLQDFLKNQNTLQLKNKLARLPGRNMWRLKGIAIDDVSSGKTAADSLFKYGYKVFGWDLEWQHDGKTGVPIQTIDDMVEKIERLLTENKTVKKNHLVLLSHDEMFRNGWEESELKQLILKLKAKGNYRFEHLSNYPD